MKYRTALARQMGALKFAAALICLCGAPVPSHAQSLSDLHQALISTDTDKQRQAINMIAGLQERQQEDLVARLRDDLNDSNVSVVCSAAHVLGGMPQRLVSGALGPLPELLSILEHDNGSIREEVARSIYSIDPQLKNVLVRQKVSQIVESSVHGTAKATRALWSMMRAGVFRQPIAQLLTQRLTSSRHAEQTSAIYALENMRPDLNDIAPDLENVLIGSSTTIEVTDRVASLIVALDTTTAQGILRRLPESRKDILRAALMRGMVTEFVESGQHLPSKLPALGPPQRIEKKEIIFEGDPVLERKCFYAGLESVDWNGITASIKVTSPRWILLHWLHVGSRREDVLYALGPPARDDMMRDFGDTEDSPDWLHYVSGHDMPSRSSFHLKNGRVDFIEWVYYID